MYLMNISKHKVDRSRPTPWAEKPKRSSRRRVWHDQIQPVRISHHLPKLELNSLTQFCIEKLGHLYSSFVYCQLWRHFHFDQMFIQMAHNVFMAYAHLQSLPPRFETCMHFPLYHLIIDVSDATKISGLGIKKDWFGNAQQTIPCVMLLHCQYHQALEKQFSLCVQYKSTLTSTTARQL